ncbi:MAG TPA: PQQ-binding-like beta-propeller repeat protein [Bacteroidales bacterium]|nr:PQQ-binding-like beta-propeller repeat protein [Bacteroidales bacterium]
MKKSFIQFSKGILPVLLLLITVMTVRAGGPEFRELQKIKLPFTPSTHWYTHTDDFHWFLCSTKADMLMLDGVTGKILWKKNFEKDFSNKKFANQHWNKVANVVLVYDEDSRKGIAMKYFIDGKTGNLLWSSDKYISDLGDYELSDGFSNYYDVTTNGVLLPTRTSVDLVDVTTGKVRWSVPVNIEGKGKGFDCYIMKYYDLVKIETKESGTYYTVDGGKEVTDIEPFFNRKKFLANQEHASLIDIPDKGMYVLMMSEGNRAFRALTGVDLPKMEVTFMGIDSKTDKTLWTKKYTMMCAINWVNRYEHFIRMVYDEGRIFVEHNPSPKPNTGLTVIDPATGDLLWEASFKASEMKISGLSKTLTTPFPAPDPLTADGKTFVVNKIKNIVSCYESATGKKLWDSEDFPDAQKIPSLICTDGVLIMGHGGGAKKCASITQQNGPSIERYEYNNKDKYGVIAYDAATGKIIWSNETLRKKTKDKFDIVAGLEMIDGKLFCATDRNLFVLNPKTGDVLNSIPVENQKAGDAWSMIWFPKEQKIILNCEKGIVKIDPKAMKIEGKVTVPTFPMFLPSEDMMWDDDYQDYAVFTKGDGTKMDLKEWASIDLDRMVVRGIEDAKIMGYNIPHFSDGAEMFYKVDGGELTIYSVK